MSALIKVFGGGLAGMLTVGLLGCGCLLPSTWMRPATLYTDMYEAEALKEAGQYRKALAKYEHAYRKFPRFPVETQVIHVSFPALLKYHIAFCYAKLAETERNISLYSEAEAAAQQSYRTAILASDQADALYLWAYILFKKGRYQEARAKFEALLEILQQNAFGPEFTVDTLFGLGNTLIGLGDKAAAQQVAAKLLERLKGDDDPYDYYTVQAWFGLGRMYLALGDKAAAARAFTHMLERIEIELREDFVPFGVEIRYEQTLLRLGNVYMDLGDDAAAARVFARLLKHFPESAHASDIKRLLDSMRSRNLRKDR